MSYNWNVMYAYIHILFRLTKEKRVIINKKSQVRKICQYSFFYQAIKIILYFSVHSITWTFIFGNE